MELNRIAQQVRPLTHCILGNFSCFLSAADVFQNKLLKNSFRNTIRISNSLDPDQARKLIRRA